MSEDYVQCFGKNTKIQSDKFILKGNQLTLFLYENDFSKR